LRYLSDSKQKLFSEKDKLSLEDLKSLSKTYLKNSIDIPGMKKDISDDQLKTLVTLLDDNGILTLSYNF